MLLGLVSCFEYAEVLPLCTYLAYLGRSCLLRSEEVWGRRM